VAIGTGVTRTTARLESGWPAIGSELVGGRGLVDVDLAGPVKAADFIGRAAHLERSAKGPAAILATLEVVDHRSSSGEPRFLMGGEPVFTADGAPVLDAGGRQVLVTSAGDAPSLASQLLMAFLPTDLAVPGTALSAEYFGERYPVRVASVGATAPGPALSRGPTSLAPRAASPG
jgi:glycine cleavage system aminomethyltransferase T